MAEIKDKIFPDYFSDKAREQIVAWGKEESVPVYRVGKYGNNDETAFLNYYEEVQRGLKVVRNKEQTMKRYREDFNSLSVSCYEEKSDIEEYYKVTLKESHPERILLFGRTESQAGLSSRTKERKTNYTNSHVDWWLYDDAEPWEYFKVEEA